jgi:subtilisin-like proprotein convertase family protein
MFRQSLFASVLLAAITPAFAQQPATRNSKDGIDKVALCEQMNELARDIRFMRTTGAGAARIEQLIAEYDALSALLGGDDPARLHDDVPAQAAVSPAATSTSGSQLLVAPSCAGAPLSTVNFAGSTGYVRDLGDSVQVFTANVAGVGTYLWDVNITTFITHTDCGDLDFGIISPAGTIVILSTDNGGAGLDNTFNGTVWDDNALAATCVDFTYVNNVTATPLNPEGRLSSFRGEDPNGTWTLLVLDDAVGDTGALNSWSVDVTTLAGAPSETTTNFTLSPALAIPDAGSTSSIINVSGIGTFMDKVTLYMELPHLNPADLDITLTSPSGTVVKVTTDNGGTFDHVFNGTLFDPSATDLAIPEFTPVVTEVVFRALGVEPLLTPEGAFDNFLGQDPNGNWTLTIADDAAGSTGTLVRWDLNITTTAAPSPSAPASFAGTTGAIADDNGLENLTFFTATVSGVGTYLWDLDLTTLLSHTYSSDIDMTITSPAGTTITVTTDNGNTGLDNVYNGTLWDENVTDTAVDHVYTDQVLATPLSSEGRLNAFRGEDPNGVWTLAIGDDLGADFGYVHAWTLGVSTLPAAPADTLTTVSNTPGLAIPDNGTLNDVMAVATTGVSITEVELFLQIPHAASGDLDITLTSPNGTVAKITTDNGGLLDNCFNGTLFDSDSTLTITDFAFTNNVTVPTLAPEGPTGVFDGENPNGNWTLTVTDDAAGSVGTLVRWDLNIRTCLGAGSAFCTNSSLGIDHTTGCPCGNTGAPGNGCGHSFDANGANMEATGSSALDTVVLHSSFEPVSSFTLMMQHANAGDSIFHDGVLCASNPLIRLRGRSAVAGEAFFPNSNFAQDSTTTLSIRGGTFPGSGATMRYAAWYRNASSTFCPPATANVTNGWVITW